MNSKKYYSKKKENEYVKNNSFKKEKKSFKKEKYSFKT